MKNMTGVEFFNAESSIIDKKSYNGNNLENFMD
jgi:hypothetical protein